MFDLDEAIIYAEEVAENKEKAINLAKGNPDHPMLSMSEKGITEYKKCINEHRQLAEWLRDYKRLKEQEPCEDAISRQAAIDFINAGHLINPNEPRWSDNEVVNFLKSRPSVNPQPKTGHWIQTNEFFINQDGQFIYKFICSECKSLSYFRKSNKKAIGANVCPNCGAKMQEVEK